MLHHRLRAASGARQNGGGGIPTDYIAFYTMDNISGSTLIDETGNYDGVITGAIQTTGIIGQALSFDGNDRVTGVAASQDFTISMWFNTTSNNVMVLYGNDMAYEHRGIFISGGAIGCFSRDSSVSYRQTAIIPGFSDGSWHHVVFSQIGNIIKIRLDDALEESLDMGSTVTYGPDARFGVSSTTSTNFYRGSIDQARIYNRELSASEITALYNEV